jgi:hypothetical protein
MIMTIVPNSDPEPDPVGSAFNLGLDLGSGSGWICIQFEPGSGIAFGIRIRILDPDVKN